LFTPENSSSTVIAHNGAGYDAKFILKYCLSRGLNPDKYIRQGSRITYMYFRKFNLRCIDSVNFFLQPLKKLSDTYSIDTLKGFFPHHFNTPENQTYIGKIPDEEFYGPSNMSEKDYKECKQWYNQQSSVSDWNFQNELKRYCEADVELLAKTVVKFRKMFKAKPIDVDPFRYVTLASLCVSIYLNLFIPEKTIVGNGSDKKDSRVCREWLNHLQNPDLRPQVPIILDIDELNITDEERNCGKINPTKLFYPKPKVSFTVDALDRKRKHVK
jgi:hypothetical protein